MLGIYFSGTGNSQYCLHHFLKKLNKPHQVFSIENPDLFKYLENETEVILAYPIYWSALPKILYDFIYKNKSLWRGKKVYILATMGLFSGDGTGCAARPLKKLGANILGGIHLKMPNCISDSNLLQKSLDYKKNLISEAEVKLDLAAQNYLNNLYSREGLNIFCRFMGFFGQRLWFGRLTKHYSDKLKIDTNLCIGCAKCTLNCPMNNLSMEKEKAKAKNQCTKCYRCINLCPQKAITLLGKKVGQSYKLEEIILREKGD